MAARFLAQLRQQWIGVIALLLVLTGGTAYALDGSNTVFTDDIVDGQVKVADIGQAAVATDELANGQVKAADIGDNSVQTSELDNGQVKTADIGDGEVRSADVANDSLSGGDVAANSLKGADVDEGTLDIGDAARAYAQVSFSNCTGTPGTCSPGPSKGISSVTRDSIGVYCVTAPGIDGAVTPAAVTVDRGSTIVPQGNASAMTTEGFSCGPDSDGFRVDTQLHTLITVDQGGGVNNATVAGPAEPSNGVSFTIVIP
jgi:hypothetical protein